MVNGSKLKVQGSKLTDKTKDEEGLSDLIVACLAGLRISVYARSMKDPDFPTNLEPRTLNLC
jgi:hypothetical protein